jgi:U1 small nuclear ribonucleoprotein C
MPRFFDDYSNTYLTHDSSAGRKQQRRGWKFRENFRLHYEKDVPDWRKGPMGLASAQQAYIRARGVDDMAVTPLPDGWKEENDDVTGITYYIDTVSKKRTWVRPGFIPPPPGGAPPRGPPPQFRGGGFQPGPPPGYNNNAPPAQGFQRQAPPLPNPHHTGLLSNLPPPPPVAGGLPPPPGAVRLPPPPGAGPPAGYR